MRSFNIKNILLGIGIGIIFTSIISMIYMAGTSPKEMSKEEIISKAKQYGMVESSPIILNEQTQTAGTKPEITPIPQSSQPQMQEIEISVNRGDSSEAIAKKLLNVGLISDKAAFIKELADMGLEMDINMGQFKIKMGTDTKTIIKIITS